MANLHLSYLKGCLGHAIREVIRFTSNNPTLKLETDPYKIFMTLPVSQKKRFGDNVELESIGEHPVMLEIQESNIFFNN